MLFSLDNARWKFFQVNWRSYNLLLLMTPWYSMVCVKHNIFSHSATYWLASALFQGLHLFIYFTLKDAAKNNNNKKKHMCLNTHAFIFQMSEFRFSCIICMVNLHFLLLYWYIKRKSCWWKSPAFELTECYCMCPTLWCFLATSNVNIMLLWQ